MNKEIKPTYVSFSQAKWLKEKGFDIPTTNYYEYALTSKKDKEYGYSGEFGWKKGECNSQNGYFINNWKDCDYSGKNWFMCSRPEQHQVIEWLRVYHNIDLQPICNYSKLGRTYRMGIIFINKENEVDTVFLRPIDTPSEFIEFNTPQEAYSAAFDYILNNNLI